MRGMKVYGKVPERRQKLVLAELKSQGYSTSVEYFTGVIYYSKKKGPKQKRVRVKDYAKQDYLKAKKQGFWNRFKFLGFVLVLLFLLNLNVEYMYRNVPEIQAKMLRDDQFTAEVNLTPVRFTDEEWADIHNKQEKEEKEIVSGDVVLEAIWKASKEYNVDYDLMKRIAKCESGFNPNAKNGSSTASGLFQHIKGTWIGHRAKMGLPTDLSLRFDPYESARTTAWSISKGGLRNWDASKSCWN